MADVTLIRAGRWGLSRPVFVDGSWSTYAMEQRLAPSVENFFPPRQADGTPLCNAVLVRLMGTVAAPADGNTVLFPRNLADLGDVQLSELTAAQRTALRNTLEGWLTGYTFTDWDGTVRTIPPFTERTATYSGDTTLKQVARDIYRHFAHSADRPRQLTGEVHNTQYLDDFSTDPSSRWIEQSGDNTGFTWDSVNSEVDVSGDQDPRKVYNANNSGSIEHEAQLTSIFTVSGGRAVGCAVRARPSTVSGQADMYGVTCDTFGNAQIWKIVAGTRSQLALQGLGSAAVDEFITQRMVAEGADGANVQLRYWRTIHGTTKPADPGWIGVDGSPDYSPAPDTAVDRLDDGTIHTNCGIGGRGMVNSIDTRCCFFKLRAVSDRAGGADTTLAAALSGTASLAAALTTQIQMAAGLSGSGAIAAALTTQITMGAQLSATGALLAALSTDIRMAAALNGSGTLAGALATDIRLASALQGLGSLTAALTTQIQMASALTGSGTLAGDLDAGSGSLSAVLAGTGQLAAALSTQITLAAQLAGSGAVAAALTTEIRMAAQLATSGTLAGDLQTDTQMAAALTGSSSLAAALMTAIELQALLQGSGSLTADLLVAQIVAVLNRIAVTLHVAEDVPRSMHVAAQVRRETTV